MNADVSIKKCHVCAKGYLWNPATCNCENGKYLVSIMDDTTIVGDEIIKERFFRAKMAKHEKYRILLMFHNLSKNGH